MEPRPFSKSQIVMFGHCQRQWAFRYVEGLKIPPSGAMKLGSSFHATAEHNYRQKPQSRTDLPLSEQTDFFAENWEKSLQQEEVVFDAGDTPDKLKDQGVEIVKAHHLQIARKVMPKSVAHVEEKVELSVGKDKAAFRLVAIIDLTDEDGVIRENKSLARTPTQKEADLNIDLSTYSLAKRIQTHEVEPKLALDVIVKNKTPVGKTIETQRSREQLRFHLNRIGMMARAIRAEAFVPNTDWWGCDPRYCGFWSRCAGRGLVTVDLGENLTQQLEDSLKESAS